MARNRLEEREAQRTEWWMDHTALAVLYRWMCDRCILDPSDVGEVAYFLSKPWKWTAEYNQMCGGDSELETRLKASLREIHVCDASRCDADTEEDLCGTHKDLSE